MLSAFCTAASDPWPKTCDLVFTTDQWEARMADTSDSTNQHQQQRRRPLTTDATQTSGHRCRGSKPQQRVPADRREDSLAIDAQVKEKDSAQWTHKDWPRERESTLDAPGLATKKTAYVRRTRLDKEKESVRYAHEDRQRESTLDVRK
ncbi:hypothetical protein PoB_002883200 [Plakobranchus ocellatus]|uniref:Uncharacterized protein n=1 Tax=Plakobranchus ocellatus TaxID=259542 RepID=A0AAV4A605_9GAST|nr:hypothetical protein PoB_002883200 [Plakobranchus ocellatus]